MKPPVLIILASIAMTSLVQAAPMTNVLSINSNQAASSNQAIDAETLDNKIEEIRRLYANTNNHIDNYQMAEFSTYQSAEGGTTKIYTQNEELKKVVETFYAETGKAIIEYYFDDNSLFFVFRQDINYNVPITHKGFDESKASIKENRYYFDRNKMIMWLDKDKQSVPSQTKRYQDRQREVLIPTTFIMP